MVLYLCDMNNLVKKTETWVFEHPLAEPDIVWTKKAYTIERYSDQHVIIWRGIKLKWYFIDKWYSLENEDAPWTPCEEPIYETIRNESAL